MFKKLILFALLAALILPAIGQDNEQRILFSDLLKKPVSTSASSILPTYVSGRYLTNNGSALSWGVIDLSPYITKNGTVPLTADWNVGAFKITSPSIVRSATLTIASATSKTLNADYYCDGTADEVQINAAIQALDGLGGRIVLMEGTFYINAPIAYSLTGTDDNNITLEGQGDSTILKLPNGHATPMSMITAGVAEAGSTIATWTATAGWTWTTVWTHSAGTTALVDDKTVAYVVGQKYRVVVGYTWVGAASTITITAGGNTGAAIADATGTSVAYEFVASATTGLTIIPTNGFTGTITSISVVPVLQNLEFRNFKIDGNAIAAQYNGIYLEGTSGAVIDNVTFFNGTLNGYALVPFNSTDVSVKNCYFANWGDNGFESRTSDRVSISNSIFNQSNTEFYSSCNRISLDNNTYYLSNISIGTDATVDISGFSFTNNKMYSPNSPAMLSVDNCDHIVISGNLIDLKTGPLVLGNDINHVTVSGNLFKSAYATCIVVGGNNGIIEGNQIVIDHTGLAGMQLAGAATVGPINWIIRNNMIYGVDGASGVIGIVVTRGTNISIYGNNISYCNYGIEIASTVVSVTAIDNVFGLNSVDISNLSGVKANWGSSNRLVKKYTLTRSMFSAPPNSLTSDVLLDTFPARTKIVGIYLEQISGGYLWAGTGVTDVDITVGKSAGGAEYLAASDVFTAAAIYGLTDAQLGTELVRAAAIQGGALFDFTNAITVYVRVTTATAHTNDLTAGVSYLYLVTESY
jgi:hypothetical protein